MRAVSAEYLWKQPLTPFLHLLRICHGDRRSRRCRREGFPRAPSQQRTARQDLGVCDREGVKQHGRQQGATLTVKRSERIERIFVSVTNSTRTRVTDTAKRTPLWHELIRRHGAKFPRLPNSPAAMKILEHCLTSAVEHCSLRPTPRSALKRPLCPPCLSGHARGDSAEAVLLFCPLLLFLLYLLYYNQSDTASNMSGATKMSASRRSSALRTALALNSYRSAEPFAPRPIATT